MFCSRVLRIPSSTVETAVVDRDLDPGLEGGGMSFRLGTAPLSTGAGTVDRVRRATGLLTSLSFSSTALPLWSTFLGAFVTSPNADRFLESCVDLDGPVVSRVAVTLAEPFRLSSGMDDDDEAVERDGLALAVASRLARVLVAAGGAFSSARRAAVRRVCSRGIEEVKERRVD